MGAQVRVLGESEIFDEFLHFRMAEGIAGFDSHFAGAHDVDIIPSRDVVGLGGSFSEFIEEVLQNGEGGFTPAESGD